MTEESNFFAFALRLMEASRLHETYRGSQCINLIASEGLKSPAVSSLLSFCKDLESRYSEGENDLEGHVLARHYQGQRYITEIENLTADLLKHLFNCDWVDHRCISGTHANLVTFKGLSMASGNGKMVVPPLGCGAHISHDYTGLAGMVIGLETIHHAFNVDEMNIDPDKSATIIRATEPGIVTFGGSLFLFPHPVRELANIAKEVGAYIVYDAAHVLGLIAGKAFQDPLEEGVDFITSSTHKTFPGPQGGLVLARLKGGTESRVKGAKRIMRAIFPMATSNTHPGRLPALGLTAVEMKVFGEALARQTVRNAQKAGEILSEEGLKVLGEKKGFTRSHQVVLDVQEWGGGKKVAETLEAANIIVNKNLLPYDDRNDRENPSGIRIGFQDVTRRGFFEGEVEDLCRLMADLIKGKKKPEEARSWVFEILKEHCAIKYGFQSIEEAIEYVEKHGKA
ncbi:MAG: serine hydroxymethyltransferase [Candidatus Bathyarchaeia archaeon]